MVKTVFLDLDDTILDFHQSEMTALRRTLQEAGVDSSDAVLDRYHVINKQHWEMLVEGKITRAQVKTLRFEKLFRELGVEREIGAICSAYEHYLAQGAFFIPGAQELLKVLASRYDLYLASNGGARVQNSRLDAAGIRGYFKGQFISEEIGANKPDPAFFAACFAAIPGFEKEKALIVGDSLTSDIRGGRNAGLRTVWFNPQGKAPRADIPADHEIRKLEELPALLEKL